MARWVTALLLLAPAALAAGQPAGQRQFREAGVCSRCHVVSVIEWSLSGHYRAGVNCVACHGASQAHVADERDNVKPDHLPRGAAIAALCMSCHPSGCRQTHQRASCAGCHHVHALVNPNKPPAAADRALESRTAAWARYSRDMKEGERLFRAGRWAEARRAFAAALGERPGERRARQRVAACGRRLRGKPPGVELVGDDFDYETGLPRRVRVSGLGTVMVLVSGGDVDLGSESYADAVPVHTVRVEPFYLASDELTQAEWVTVMGENPSAHQGAAYPRAGRMPVERISWYDAEAFLKKLNELTPGGGFRLPTEAEWELAAVTGAQPGLRLDQVAWFGASEESGAPHPVGLKQPNRLGLYDIEGNVWEWCSSIRRPYPYDASDGREELSGGGLRILRGGGYADPADLLDPRIRHAERPGRRLRWNGMRLARGVPEP